MSYACPICMSKSLEIQPQMLNVLPSISLQRIGEIVLMCAPEALKKTHPK